MTSFYLWYQWILLLLYVLTRFSKRSETDIKSPPAHLYIAIFELVRPFDHGMMPWKFRRDISDGSRVIVLTDIQTHIHKQTLLTTISSSLCRWKILFFQNKRIEVQTLSVDGIKFCSKQYFSCYGRKWAISFGRGFSYSHNWTSVTVPLLAKAETRKSGSVL